MARLRLGMLQTVLTYTGALLLVGACGKEEPNEGPAGSSDSSSTGVESTGMASATSTTTTTTTGPQMTTIVDGTTFGPGCGMDPCPQMCGPGCESTGICIASEWMCECDCPMTGTEGEGCPMLGDALDDWVEPSMTPAIDCGIVGPKDPVEDWQTVHDCVVLSAPATSFRATWSLVEGADPIELGAGARVLDGYELAWFERSEPASLTRFSCTTIEAIPDCIVEPSQMCLGCLDQTEDELICIER